LPDFVKACAIGVAPIFSGSGTRLKILEYMAAGRPVVSTTKGSEGIAVKDQDNILIADDDKSFAEKIIYLLKNREVAEEIGNEGMQMVTQNYSWQKIMKILMRLYTSYM
jgi:polysaccharide biosynthesis protein PslH